VPILQARGQFRTRYTGTTLRDHLGLSRPVGRYATARGGNAIVQTEDAASVAEFAGV
jgi:hypothetical protein